MAYQRDYQRGAIHTGLSKIKIESYALTDKDIKDYMDYQEQEDFEIITSLNESMNSLKDELMDYLKQAGEEFKQEKKLEPQKPPFLKELFSPFTNIFKGFNQMFRKSKAEKKPSGWAMEQDKKKAENTAKKLCFVLYNTFKNSHKMLS